MQKKAYQLDHDQLLHSLQLHPSVEQKFNGRAGTKTMEKASNSLTLDSMSQLFGNNKPPQNQSRFGGSNPATINTVKRNHLLAMTIDLGDGMNDKLDVYRDDNPYELAALFCQKHDLDEAAIDILAQNIKQNMLVALNERDPLNALSGGKGESTEIQKGSKPLVDSNKENLSDHFDNKEIGRKNVYDRLHESAQIKQKQKEKAEKNSEFDRSPSVQSCTKLQGSPTDSINPGHKLYIKGMRKKEETQRLIQEQKSHKLNEELKELTFKPFVSQKSKDMAKRNIDPAHNLKRTEDFLIDIGKKNKEKLERKRIEKEQEDLGKYNFTPHTNDISNKIMMEKSKVNPQQEKTVFESLYEEAKTKDENLNSMKKEKKDPEFPFHPQLVSNQKILTSEEPFLQRMEKSVKEKQEKMRFIEQSKHEMYDNEGKPLFRPNTGRAPKVERNSGNKSIGEYLYDRRQDQEKIKINLLEKEKKDLEEKRTRATEKSNALVENIKRKKLEEIFNVMDSDGDGIISAQKIEIQELSTEILEAFGPLLCEMEQLNFELNFEMFYQASSKLLKSLSVVERDNILYNYKSKWDDKKSSLGTFSFKPEINKKSIKLAETKKQQWEKEIAGITIYEKSLEYQKQVSEKIKEKKEEREKDEMKECSFKPHIPNTLKY